MKRLDHIRLYSRTRSCADVEGRFLKTKLHYMVAGCLLALSQPAAFAARTGSNTWLGDSVAGYKPPPPGQIPSPPPGFTGYPEMVAQRVPALIIRQLGLSVKRVKLFLHRWR
jgi:hypothetical protein